ncbi:hypothetical protein [Methanocella sp. MCL-LM]|uniref:hypothetical protein n=1 Tax=Methanocella sp. MCL-LM TaxID=3412035 RepID=UPI003C793AF0
MKYDKFVIGIVLLIIVLTMIAIAAVYSTPANGADANVSASGVPTVLPTAEPAAATPVATDSPVPYATVRTGPKPEKITWFGSVQDSFGKPFGGVNVTLRLMTPAGEAFNVTNVSAEGLPYPGSYFFYNVTVSPDITYAYAEASVGNLEDDITYYGRSSNYTLDNEMMSSGFIVLHVPMPDQVKITVESTKIAPVNIAYVSVPGSGLPNSTLVTAQLFLNGKPYKRSGVTISFFTDKEDVAALPGVRTNVTDMTGRASILLTGSGAGNATVTGYTRIGISRNLSDTCPVQVIN